MDIEIVVSAFVTSLTTTTIIINEYLEAGLKGMSDDR